MAIQENLGLTRDQLSKFLQNQEQIRQFELLFECCNTGSAAITALQAQLVLLEARVAALEAAV